ncbi:hypothetical protein [Nocardioides sp. AX2bis]|uniref:hypothetical protein n=1 Tax=Nocardioides sp. AX2bis TaxID=2653157 RepID=UPI0012EF3A1C|nr:hypothetical protein [Nocardioides sp. AX2bis]VXB43852.1 hypothetical protein NOCARDAX2BIS_220130 [Nocardioides sp. AX2bis]
MTSDLRIRSDDDETGRDAAVLALRAIPTDSGQVLVVGITLIARGPVFHTTNQAGLESSHHLGYPASLEDLTAALNLEDELAVGRSEMCAAALTWMADHDVSSSPGFGEFFRWAVFVDMILDTDGLALITGDGTPATLPVGWVHEPSRDGHGEVVRVQVERPHVADVRASTGLTIRADGWSGIRIASTRNAGPEIQDSGTPTPPPAFVTFRRDYANARSYAWSRNEEAQAEELIHFVQTHHRDHDDN